MLYVKSLGFSLPRIKTPDDLIPNTTPHVGAAILFKYKRSNEPHIALITAVDENSITIVEANYKPCQKGTRRLEWGSEQLTKNLRGFYSPSAALS